MTVKVGDVFAFIYEKEPQYNCVLTAVRVEGMHPDDFVFWNDGTHSKQRDCLEKYRIPTERMHDRG